MQQPRVRCFLAVAPALALALLVFFFSDIAAAFLGCCVSLDFFLVLAGESLLFDFLSIRNPSAIFYFLFSSLTILFSAFFCLQSLRF
jgi:hypothetical protein